MHNQVTLLRERLAHIVSELYYNFFKSERKSTCKINTLNLQFVSRRSSGKPQNPSQARKSNLQIVSKYNQNLLALHWIVN